MKIRRREDPQSKTKAVIQARRVLPMRKCIGSRMDVDCERMFKPTDRFNRLCDLCLTYISRNNLSD